MLPRGTLIMMYSSKVELGFQDFFVDAQKVEPEDLLDVTQRVAALL
jgi:hypothetical protein